MYHLIENTVWSAHHWLRYPAGQRTCRKTVKPIGLNFTVSDSDVFLLQKKIEEKTMTETNQQASTGSRGPMISQPEFTINTDARQKAMVAFSVSTRTMTRKTVGVTVSTHCASSANTSSFSLPPLNLHVSQSLYASNSRSPFVVSPYPFACLVVLTLTTVVHAVAYTDPT